MPNLDDLNDAFVDVIDWIDGLWLLFLNSLGSGDEGNLL